MASQKMSRIARRFISGILLTGILFLSAQVVGQEHQSITVKELWTQRPANMFKLSTNTDSAVCNPLLASLNAARRIAHPPRRYLSERVSKMPQANVFPLLRNKFIADVWQFQKYKWTRMPGVKQQTYSWEAAFLDMDGDGVKDGIFRQSLSLSGNLYHQVWFVRAANEWNADNELLDEDTVRKLRGESGNEFPTSGYWNIYIELIRIGSQPYAIVTDAAYWTLKDYPRFPEIELLEFTAGGWKIVCFFKGTVEIRRRN